MNLLFKYCCAIVCVIAISSTSQAQTYHSKNTGSSWAGIYGGGHGGGAWGEAEDQAGETLDVDGGIGGIHAGYNFQFGQWVAGIEGDYSWSGADGSEVILFPPGISATATVESDYLASIRARLGYAFDNVLVYTTAGVGFSNVDLAVRVTGFGQSVTASGDDSVAGFVGGGGIEWMPWKNVSVRAEVLHYAFGDADISDVVGGQNVNLDVDLDQTVVRGGFSIHLN